MNLLYSFLARLNFLFQKIQKTSRCLLTKKTREYLLSSHSELLMNSENKDSFVKYLNFNYESCNLKYI